MNEIFKQPIGDIIEYVRVLKTEYQKSLALFFDGKTIRKWRAKIYAFEIEEWKKERIWEFMNGDVDVDVLKHIK